MSAKKSNKRNKNNQVIIDQNIRENTVKLINKYIQDSKLSKDIENEIFNHSLKSASLRGVNPKLNNINFIRIYKPKVYSIISNLNTNSEYIQNKKLLDKVKSKSISPNELVNMKPVALHPKRWKEYIKKQELLDKEVVDLSLQATTDQFKCPKCKSKKCTYVSVQIRSADEGMTNFITCVECSNSWRQG
jgi:transcription elongation factor S-II